MDYERQHALQVARILRQLDNIYNDACREAAAIGLSVGDIDLSEALFKFSDYPITTKRVEKLLSGLQTNIETAIVNGVRSQWTLANNKNNALSQRVFGKNVSRLTDKQYERYFNNHDKALDAFLSRKESGLRLSDRVWNYTNQFKDEIEMGLSVALGQGKPANELATELKQYLKYPDKLFRRVRNEYGELVLSKAAEAFRPGRGVYRSSFKNARRLAATETNIAYRSADFLRAQELPFIVGIQIRLSKAHPVYDICDELQGKYPKDFKFTGWHPHCICHVETILKTPEEVDADVEAVLNGTEISTKSVNEVKNTPAKFNDWLFDNQERLEKARTLPYFIRDNQSAVNNVYNQTSYLKAGNAGSGTPVIGKNNLSKPIDDLVGIDYITKKTTPITENDIEPMLKAFEKANPGVFPGGLEQVLFVDGEYFMGHTRLSNGKHRLLVSTKTHPEKNNFNPKQHLISALEHIRTDKSLSFGEEYALESLWHEILHARAVGWGVVNEDVRGVMEIVNQFCARRSYPYFIKALGGKSYNHIDIVNDGYGYASWLRNFYCLIDTIGIKRDAIYEDMLPELIYGHYEEIRDSLIQCIANRSSLSTNNISLLIDLIELYNKDCNGYARYVKLFSKIP